MPIDQEVPQLASKMKAQKVDISRNMNKDLIHSELFQTKKDNGGKKKMLIPLILRELEYYA